MTCPHSQEPKTLAFQISTRFGGHMNGQLLPARTRILLLILLGVCLIVATIVFSIPDKLS